MIFDNFIISIILYKLFKTDKELNQIIDILLIVFFIVSIYGIITFVMKRNPYIELISSSLNNSHRDLIFNYDNRIRSDIYGRIQSTFSHPISFGAHLCVFIPIILWRAKRVAMHKKVFLYIALLLCIMNIFLTNSRSPIIFF